MASGPGKDMKDSTHIIATLQYKRAKVRLTLHPASEHVISIHLVFRGGQLHKLKGAFMWCSGCELVLYREQ